MTIGTMCGLTILGILVYAVYYLLTHGPNLVYGVQNAEFTADYYAGCRKADEECDIMQQKMYDNIYESRSRSDAQDKLKRHIEHLEWAKNTDDPIISMLIAPTIFLQNPATYNYYNIIHPDTAKYKDRKDPLSEEIFRELLDEYKKNNA